MVEGYDERVVTRRKDFLFRKGTLDFIAFNHLLLAQDWCALASHECNGGHWAPEFVRLAIITSTF